MKNQAKHVLIRVTLQQTPQLYKTKKSYLLLSKQTGVSSVQPVNHKTPWNFFLTEHWYAPSSGWLYSLKIQFSTWTLEIVMMGQLTLSFLLWFQLFSQRTLHISAFYQITLHDHKVSLWCTTNAVTITDPSKYGTFTSQFIAASECHCAALLCCVSLLALTPILGTSQNCKKWQLASSCLPVQPPTWNNSVQTRQIFMKFYIWAFFSKIHQEKFKFH